jgi:hypothetical protein
LKLKRAVLEQMTREDLKQAVDALDIKDVDHRSVEIMAHRLSRAHRATPEFLLGLLSEVQVKAVSEAMGLQPTGRKSALVAVLLEHESGVGASAQSAEQAMSTAASSRGRRGRRGEGRITRYTYDEIKEPRTPETGQTPLLPAEEQVVTLPMHNGWSKAVVVGNLSEGDKLPVVVDMDPVADPILFWAGKRNRREVPVLPLQRNEIVSESSMPPITSLADARKRIEGRRVSTHCERLPGKSW